jgi:hypothetical protein
MTNARALIALFGGMIEAICAKECKIKERVLFAVSIAFALFVVVEWPDGSDCSDGSATSAIELLATL